MLWSDTIQTIAIIMTVACACSFVIFCISRIK